MCDPSNQRRDNTHFPSACLLCCSSLLLPGFPGGSVVKNPPAMQGTRVQPPHQEGPLEQETVEVATHSSTAAWEISQTEEPEGAQSRGSQESDTTEGPNSSLLASRLEAVLLTWCLCREMTHTHPEAFPSR